MFRRGPSPSRATPRHLSAGGRELAAHPAHRAPGPALRRPTTSPAEARHRAALAAAEARHRADAAAFATAAVTIDELEVPPIARVKRSRLAFAVAVSIAALPVIVLDNLPSTAEANEAQVETDGRDLASSSSSEQSTTTVAPSTTSTEAPTTTAAAETTTSEAPATSEVQEIQTFAAPAPTAPPTTAAPTTTAPPAPRYGDPDDPATWDRLAQCESGGNWAMNSGNGYYGGLQFSLATWQSVGGTGYPHHASRNEQIHRGQILQSRAGWGQWPACSAELGYT